MGHRNVILICFRMWWAWVWRDTETWKSSVGSVSSSIPTLDWDKGPKYFSELEQGLIGPAIFLNVKCLQKLRLYHYLRYKWKQWSDSRDSDGAIMQTWKRQICRKISLNFHHVNPSHTSKWFELRWKGRSYIFNLSDQNDLLLIPIYIRYM